MNRSKLASIVLAVTLVALRAAPAQGSPILYAMSIDTTASELYIVDPTRGAATLGYKFPTVSIEGNILAYDNLGGSLYATAYDNTNIATLFSVNLSTDVATATNHTRGGKPEFGGLVVDPSSGIVYASGSDGFQITGNFTFSSAGF